MPPRVLKPVELRVTVITSLFSPLLCTLTPVDGKPSFRNKAYPKQYMNLKFRQIFYTPRTLISMTSENITEDIINAQSQMS
jgi:hypothetical protein